LKTSKEFFFLYASVLYAVVSFKDIKYSRKLNIHPKKEPMSANRKIHRQRLEPAKSSYRQLQWEKLKSMSCCAQRHW